MAKKKRAVSQRASDALLKDLLRVSLKLLQDPDARMHELGQLMVNVSVGQDARQVFRQDERHKPTQGSGESIALVYYYLGADKNAAEFAMRVPGAPKSLGAVKNLARRHRNSALTRLQKECVTKEGARRIQCEVYSDVYSKNRDPEHDKAAREFFRTWNPNVNTLDWYHQLADRYVPRHTAESIATLVGRLEKKRPRADAY